MWNLAKITSYICQICPALAKVYGRWNLSENSTWNLTKCCYKGFLGKWNLAKISCYKKLWHQVYSSKKLADNSCEWIQLHQMPCYVSEHAVLCTRCSITPTLSKCHVLLLSTWSDSNLENWTESYLKILRFSECSTDLLVLCWKWCFGILSKASIIQSSLDGSVLSMD